jgi:hypothetical protein
MYKVQIPVILINDKFCCKNKLESVAVSSTYVTYLHKEVSGYNLQKIRT